MLKLGRSKSTPAAAQLIALSGLTNSFEEAAERKLAKMSGLRVSDSTVQRVTENAGQRLAQLLAEDDFVVDQQHWQWHVDARGQTCAYISLDHTGVRQQAAGGGSAEGRMVAVGMVYNPNGRGTQVGQRRYVAGLHSLEELGRQLRCQAQQVGLHRAEQWIVLTDGANGFEQLIERDFPLAQAILDFWHAAEHAAELARAAHPADESAFTELHQRWRHKLKHEGGWALLAEWEQMELTGASLALREAHAEQTRYFRNNVHRMDYPSYLANGWRIGSGPVEAACKTVVGQRLKGTGMRWREAGTDSVAHLRALYLSEPILWEAFWKDHPN